MLSLRGVWLFGGRCQWTEDFTRLLGALGKRSLWNFVASVLCEARALGEGAPQRAMTRVVLRL